MFGGIPFIYHLCSVKLKRPNKNYKNDKLVMRTQILSKAIFTLLLAVMCGFAAQASSPRNYLYDTKEENGLIVSKTIFLQSDNGMLDKQVKYEFAYGANGKVSVKKAYRWNAMVEKWVPFYQAEYTYDEKNNEIRYVYGLWNNKTNKYDMNVQNMVIPFSNYNEIFS